MLGIIISRAGSTFRVHGSRSKVTMASLLKNFDMALVPTFFDGFQYYFIQMFGRIIF